MSALGGMRTVFTNCSMAERNVTHFLLLGGKKRKDSTSQVNNKLAQQCLGGD